MIIFKENNLMYVAIPMGYHAYSNKSQTDVDFPENWDAFFTGDDTNTIVAVDSVSDRTIDLLRYSGLFDCEITQKSLYGIKSKIDKLIEGTNVDCEETDYGVIVCRDNKAYEMRSYGFAVEVGDFERLGESRQYSYAIYENVKSIENIEERVRKYYNHMNSVCGGNMFPVVLLSTANKEYKVIEK